MLSLNLAPIFKARRIDKPYTFLVKAGISPTCASKILNSQTNIFRLNHIELLCKILVCEPNDLLLWTPEDGHVYAENFPLSKLSQTNANNDLKNTLETIPYKQLKEVTNTILNKERA